MSSLFPPYTVRSLEIPNRVWMSPMHVLGGEPRPRNEVPYGLASDAPRQPGCRGSRTDHGEGHCCPARWADHAVGPRAVER